MKTNILFLEFISILFTLLVIVLVLLPIYNNVIDYPFYIPNIVLIFLFFTFVRYIFFLEYTFLARLNWLKVIFVLTSIPIIFLIAQEVSVFQNIMDEDGFRPYIAHLHTEEQFSMIKYTKNQFIFFGTAATICAVIFPFRMIISVWRAKNKGTV